MDIAYKPYYNKALYLSLALISIGYDYREDGVSVNVSDYIKIMNWLDVKVESNTNSKEITEKVLRGRSTALSFVISRILYCNENYISFHIDLYKYNTIKEYFNDFQILKHTIA